MKYYTSPFLFYYKFNEKVILNNVLTKDKYQIMDSNLIKALFFFMKKHSLKEAKSNNIETDILDYLLENNLIIEHSIELSKWEGNNWSKMALLLFSQQNLLYKEFMDKTQTPESIKEETIKEYEKNKRFPKNTQKKFLKIINLPINYKKNKFDINVIKNRRTIRSYKNEPISLNSFFNVICNSIQYLKSFSKFESQGKDLLKSYYTWLDVYIVTQRVSEIDKGVYFLDIKNDTLNLITQSYSDHDLSRCVANQPWIKGGGFCVFFVVNWEQATWLYRHSRAYLKILIRLGEIGQEFVNSAYSNDLGAWMTPAIQESLAAKILRLDNVKEDAMYFMKIGPYL